MVNPIWQLEQVEMQVVFDRAATHCDRASRLCSVR
jgi:hypothetical protein